MVWCLDGLVCLSGRLSFLYVMLFRFCVFCVAALLWWFVIGLRISLLFRRRGGSFVGLPFAWLVGGGVSFGAPWFRGVGLFCLGFAFVACAHCFVLGV